MYKIWGSILVVFGCGYWGWLKGMELKRKLRYTEGFIRSIETLKREITEKHRLIPQIIIDLGENRKNITSEYFRILAEKMCEDTQESFAQRWEESMRKGFPEELREILAPLGQVLGQFDGNTQGEALDSVLRELRHFKGRQEEENQKKTQVYGAFGVTSGVFLVILLL